MLQQARVGASEIRLVPDASYLPELLRLIRDARERLWCSLFLVDLDPQVDPELRVGNLLRELAAAHWRGVDVRLLLGGSRSNLDIAMATATAFAVASRLRIPSRGLGLPGTRGSHVKLVVADDWVLTGSHNWSIGAFTDQVQDSVVVHSPDLAAYGANYILAQWRRADDAHSAP